MLPAHLRALKRAMSNQTVFSTEKLYSDKEYLIDPKPSLHMYYIYMERTSSLKSTINRKLQVYWRNIARASMMGHEGIIRSAWLTNWSGWAILDLPSTWIWGQSGLLVPRLHYTQQAKISAAFSKVSACESFYWKSKTNFLW